jgi:hypothetical protein
VLACSLVSGLVDDSRAQSYTVKADRDTILAGEEEVRLTVAPGDPNMGLFCIARKGGGNFTDFQNLQKDDGVLNEAIFTTPFPGEVVIDVLDKKFNKLGTVTVYAAAPTVEILENESYDRIDFATKSMPLVVRVLDHHGKPVKNASLVCRLHEIVAKKPTATTSKVSAFVLKGDRYEATISGLKDASYRVEVFDAAHLEIFDRAENPDNPHPAAVIEGMNVSFQ